ncbi:MAG: HAMP domain-containing protein [Bacteroidales bacterium]|nr:HAMP domain-containing protein [Bacteroidales bacterium]
MRLPRYSITTKLLLLFLLVGISTVLIVGSYAYYSARKAIINRTMDQLISVRAVKKQQLSYFFSEKVRNLENLYDKDQLTSFFPGGKRPVQKLSALTYLQNYCQAYGFTNLYIISTQPGLKGCISITTQLKGIPPAVYQHIQSIIKESARNRISITDLFFREKGDSVPVCLIGCRFSSPGSPYAVVVISEIPATAINQIMLQDNSRIGLGKSGEAYLVGNDFLMRSSSRFIRHSLLKVPVHSGTAILAADGRTGTSMTNDYRGIKVFSAYEPLPVPDLKWIILAEIDYNEAMIPVIALRNDILLVSIIISFFILGFSQIITRMVTQPIIRLKNAATSLGEGNFDQKVDIRSNDEIGSLAETFNTMSDQVKEERRKRIQALYDGQEMERRRISRELHDGLGQKMIGAKLQLENCDEADLSCLQKTLAGIKSELRDIVDELRRISNDLMPASLDDLGLITALQNLSGDVEKQTGLKVDFDASLTRVPGNDTAVYIFRIAQEGISNIIKHAGASNISMQLIENRDALIFILEDDGAGFDPAKAGKGNGLYNMKERAGLLGGNFSVESGPGKGTTLRVKIPFLP